MPRYRNTAVAFLAAAHRRITRTEPNAALAVDLAEHLRREEAPLDPDAGLDLDLDLDIAAPVIGHSDFAARQRRLRAALSRIQAEPLPLN